MARIRINTQAQKYQNYLSGLNNLITDMRPRLRVYHRLNKQQQNAWRAADPLLDLMVRFATRFNKAKDD